MLNAFPLREKSHGSVKDEDLFMKKASSILLLYYNIANQLS
jgi:hypothetical protein